jgi:hypothetical protein
LEARPTLGFKGRFAAARWIGRFAAARFGRFAAARFGRFAPARFDFGRAERFDLARALGRDLVLAFGRDERRNFDLRAADARFLIFLGLRDLDLLLERLTAMDRSFWGEKPNSLS